jgi:hypothetical protein
MNAERPTSASSEKPNAEVKANSRPSSSPPSRRRSSAKKVVMNLPGSEEKKELSRPSSSQLSRRSSEAVLEAETVMNLPEANQPGEISSRPPSASTKEVARPASSSKVNIEVDSKDRPPSLKKDEITVIIRPFCGDWQMGEDWTLRISFLATFVDLKEFIEEVKGISRHRIQIKLKGKLLTGTREKWTLRRMGIYDAYVIQIEPTLVGSWWWNDYYYYVDILLRQIETIIDEKPDGGIFLSDLIPLVQIPPPVKVSLKVFIRSYPERLHVHCNTVENTYWIEKLKSTIEIPTFSSFPHYLGKFPYAKLPPFDWDSYKDIDDKYKVEAIEIEEEKKEVQPSEGETEIHDEDKEVVEAEEEDEKEDADEAEESKSEMNDGVAREENEELHENHKNSELQEN